VKLIYQILILGSFSLSIGSIFAQTKDSFALQKDTNSAGFDSSNRFHHHTSVYLKNHFPLAPGFIPWDSLKKKTDFSFEKAWVQTKLKHNEDQLFYRKDLSQAFIQYRKAHPPIILSKKKFGEARPIRSTWILVIILLLISLFTLVKVQFPKDLENLNTSLFRDRLIRDERELTFLDSFPSMAIILCFSLSYSFLIYFFLRDRGISSSLIGLELFGILCFGILIFFLLKYFFLSFLGHVFQIHGMIKSYMSIQYVAMANFTLVFIPFILVYALTKSAQISYLVFWIPILVLAFFAFLFSRSLYFLVSNYRFSYFYLFLYFCAVEICPMLIVLKVIYA